MTIDDDLFVEGEPRFERALDWTGVGDPAESLGLVGRQACRYVHDQLDVPWGRLGVVVDIDSQLI